MTSTFSDFAARLREFIRDSMQRAATAPGFNDLALELFRLQFAGNAAYRALCEFRRINPDMISDWQNIPAVPASAFKELELTSLAPDERTTVFFSSGTTEQKRSRHFHSVESLAIYEASLLPWFERHLLRDLEVLVEEQLLGPIDKLPMLSLTPPRELAPNSSLVHMFDAALREFGARDSLFVGGIDESGAWTIEMDRALFAIRKSMCANRPLVLLGTAFNFVQLVDHFAANNMRYRLARGSRALETGGYKGRSREIPKAELHTLISKHLGIARTHIVTEYGMSELSSQAYDCVVETSEASAPSQGTEEHRVLRFPAWARAQIISPESNLEVSDGETGLLRIVDLANVRSVMAIQTEDLAVRRGDVFELLGRATAAEARGCSLMSLGVPR
ncbi:MAG TPA: hypothetical protein VK530_21565 [Candidatus Acidoferrum sp.]|nr:hypothetical protein [Candidatus Acidoferrum sp.]